MNKILEQYFIKTYPKIFRDMYGDPKATCMAWGISTQNGWFFLLNNLCGIIQYHIDNHNKFIKSGYIKEEIIPQVIVAQIKSKFGGLRFYYDGGDKQIRAYVDMAEYMSYTICEECGVMNQCVGETKGWIEHICIKCAGENNKEITVNKQLVNLWDSIKDDKKQ